MRHTALVAILLFCLLALAGCTGGQDNTPRAVQFYLEEDGTPFTKGAASVVLEPTAVFPEGERQDTLWVAAVSREMRTGDVPTKGIPYNATEGFPTEGTLGLMAYTYATHGADTTSWTLYTASNDSRTVCYVPEASRWIPAPDLFYPTEEGYIRFFAFGPKDAQVTGVSARDHAGPALSYTAPADLAAQRGLLVAAPDQRPCPPGLLEMGVPLDLQHVLSGVRFAVSNRLKLVSVSVSGVYDQGVYYVVRGRWNTLGKSVTTPSWPISISNYAEDMVAGTAAFDCVAPRFTLLMIPQRLPTGATVSVRVQKEDLSYLNYNIDVGGQLWEKGKLTQYVIADIKMYFGINVNDYPSFDPLDWGDEEE